MKKSMLIVIGIILLSNQIFAQNKYHKHSQIPKHKITVLNFENYKNEQKILVYKTIFGSKERLNAEINYDDSIYHYISRFNDAELKIIGMTKSSRSLMIAENYERSKIKINEYYDNLDRQATIHAQQQIDDNDRNTATKISSLEMQEIMLLNSNSQ